MKVKRSSWHYKLTSFIWRNLEYRGNNLCKYFWMMAWSLTIVCVIILFISGYSYMIYDTIFKDGSTWAIFRICIILFVLSLLITPCIAISYFRKFVGKDIIVTVKVPNILSEFIKAKKDKYCPMIDFE